MKAALAVLTLLFLGVPHAPAQDTVATPSSGSTSGTVADVGQRPAKRYYTEFAYQVHSLPMTGSQMFGPALAYKINSMHSAGTRYLLAPESSDERRLSVFWRMSFGRRYFHWVIEPQYSYLWRRPIDGNFSTTGFSAGFNYSVREDLLIGTMVGLEQAGPTFPVGPFWSRPTVLFLTQFGF